MKKLILILLVLCLPMSAFALDQMKDKDLDQVTARFGASAAGDASALAAPAGDASTTAGNVTPLTPPAALVGQAIADGAYGNDRVNDVTGMTTFVVNTSNMITAPSLGFF